MSKFLSPGFGPLWLAGALALALAGPAQAAGDARDGEAALRAGNFDKAYLELLLPGRGGNARAQFLLGWLSDNGLGAIKLDPVEALRWYREAAGRGNGAAMRGIARAYALGRGVKLDPGEAMMWLVRSAESGHGPAMLDLSVLYERGRGVERDLGQAISWERRAAEVGSAEGQYRYARRIEEGRGVKANQAEAELWLQRAAARGHPAALLRLAQTSGQLDSIGANRLAAHMLATLAAKRGIGDVRKAAQTFKGELEAGMLAADVAESQRLVRDWQPSEPDADAENGEPVFAPAAPSNGRRQAGANGRR